MDRYFLDIRSGCAAVRDRQHPGYDEDYPGLHRVMLDVVEYRHGLYTTEHDLGGLSYWGVKQEDIDYLQDICDKLNVWPDREKKLKELGI